MTPASAHTDPLEIARTRLEGALSRLASDVLRLKDQCHTTEAHAASLSMTVVELQHSLANTQSERADIRGALERVEKENLQLHEKIASLTLSERMQDNADSALRAEKESLEQNFTRLQSQYDALRASANTSSAAPASSSSLASLESEIASLKADNEDLRREREAIRSRLDAAIAQVETLISEDV